MSILNAFGEFLASIVTAAFLGSGKDYEDLRSNAKLNRFNWETETWLA